MAKLPLVAIIGRPNTGKSTLFNRLVRRRVAIESEVPGTTRDHVTSIVETPDLDYLLIDTGGMGGGTEDKDFEDDVHAQSLLALKAADVIVFTVDGREEPTRNDFAIADLLRKKSKRRVPVLLVINKCDNEQQAENAEHAFHELGIGDETFLVSAAHRIGTEELEQSIVRHLGERQFGKRSERSEADSLIPRIAIIGKPNVGKSSITNALMSETQREISPKLVSDIPGTTRDATDTLIRWQDQDFLFIDTAGLRKNARVEEGVESLSMLRTIQSLDDCDVALLVLDATEPPSKQDKKIAGLAVDAGKCLIILLNKTDLITTEQKMERKRELMIAFQFCRWAPVIPCSAVSREGLLKIFDMALAAQRNRQRRLPVKELHRFIVDAVADQPMSSLASAKHIVQAKNPPPTFIVFVKNPKRVQLSQLRFLENRLRETFGLEATPIRIITKGPKDREKEDE